MEKTIKDIFKLMQNVRFELLKGGIKLFFELLVENKIDSEYVKFGEKIGLWKAKEEISSKTLQDDLMAILGHQFTDKDSLVDVVNKIAEFVDKKIDEIDIDKILKKKKRSKEEKLWLRFFLRIVNASLIGDVIVGKGEGNFEIVNINDIDSYIG